MTKTQKILLVLLRIGFGWLFLYAAYEKFSAEPAWSAAGYLLHAKTLPEFYAWLASDGILQCVNFFNMYGQLAIGLSLLVGLFTRLGGIFGALMMALYYFPILAGLHPNEHALIVDEHILYGLALLLLTSFHAGTIFGLDGILKTWYDRHPMVGNMLR